MNEGGQLFDAGGKDWLVSATAQFLANQGLDEYYWVNAAKVSVNNQGKVWSFKDGECKDTSCFPPKFSNRSAFLYHCSLYVFSHFMSAVRE